MKIYKLPTSDTEFIITDGLGITRYVDTIEKLVVQSAYHFQIKLDEIEYALVEMTKKDHNFCEFGKNKMFLSSKKISTNKPLKYSEMN